MSNPIRIGLVGLGRAGVGMHLPELSTRTDRFQVVAVCDIIEERALTYGEKLGAKAAEVLLQLIAGRKKDATFEFDTRVVERQSVKQLD